MLLLSITISAQRPDRKADIWFFGDGVPLQFRGGQNPAVISGNNMTSRSSSSIISDKNGNLVMYSNGQKVWNNLGAVIEGADNLVPSNDPKYPGLIIPIPENKGQYYVLAVDDSQGSSSPNVISFPIYISKIDMQANGGLGKLVEQSLPLWPETSFGMTTVKHCNNVDYWLIIHKGDTNGFLVYLIDKDGIHKDEVSEYKLGTTFVGSSQGLQQEILSSEDGSVLAITKPIEPEGGFLETFAFDNSSGEITQKLATIRNLGQIKGMAISPDGKLVYISRFIGRTPSSFDTDAFQDNYEVRQFKTTEDPAYDKTIFTDGFVGKNGNTPMIESGSFGNLKLGPDAKIYMAHKDTTKLSVIHLPNEEGINCNFEEYGLDLGNRKSGTQLPATISPDYKAVDAKLVFQGEKGVCRPILKVEADGFSDAQTTYAWYIGDSLLNVQKKETLKTVGPGNYSAIIKDACHEIKTNVQIITTGGDVPPPRKDTLITSCAFVELERFRVNGQNLKWYNDEALTTLISQENDFDIPLDYNVPQTHSFYLTQTQNGCESEAAKITFQVIDNTPIEFVDSLLKECFTGNNGIKPELVYDFPGELVWYKDGQLFSNEDSPLIFTYGNYTVKRADNRCEAEDSILIEDGCLKLFLPTAFSPNGDGLNEEFKIFGKGFFEIDFELIDRNNQILKEIDNAIFDSDEMTLWDGTIDKEPAPSGLYFYVLKIRNQVDKTVPEEIRTGNITLTR
ncbi:hypothetical protein AFM12_05955 [Jiulongibacter sediminis]|uniref:Ig-like domain-containing protein n=1 Tax=Jiulongibacter sediminis TaxID=1605367 RepID=A0A0P7C0T8_9BACT|nr:hypothetical protein AFM12_05955 [Jiulongibacter sediminis]TBX24749.1 hypothetical protein TK44_05960 [Jiulongibacter sediminis]